MKRLETLKKLESTLTAFLDKAVETEGERIEALRSLDALDDIAQESLKGRFIGNRLGNWLAENRNLLQSSRFAGPELDTIGNLLADVRSGLNESEPESKKLAEEIDNWRGKGLIPKRKLILKLRARPEEDSLVDKFSAFLTKESEHIGSGEFADRHLLSVLDDTLKSAEAKEDTMYIHLAASIIYFLKMNGYKVIPFIKRLKDIEKRKFESHAE